ncbi:MAG: metallophosphoesterase family protein [Burkholderiaceae bacterium]
MAASALKIGIISDTHGLLRPEATAALSGVDRIIHAGDIGKPEILEQLAGIAPVMAVRGNNDMAAWAADLPHSQVLEAGGIRIFLIHDVKEIDIDLHAAGIHAVIAGHSHRPLIETRDGILFINPGSAGPRRFSLPISLALLEVNGGVPQVAIHRLDKDERQG